jgi:hypothetical protein
MSGTYPTANAAEPCQHTWQYVGEYATPESCRVTCRRCGSAGTVAAFLAQVDHLDQAYADAHDRDERTFEAAAGRLARAARDHVDALTGIYFPNSGALLAPTLTPLVAALEDVEGWMEEAGQDVELRKAALGSDGQP